MVVRLTVAFVFLLIVSMHAFPQKNADPKINVFLSQEKQKSTENEAENVNNENNVTNSGKTLENGVNNNIADKVSYNGAQLWKLLLDTNSKKITIARLLDSREISPWGGNTSTLDILVPPQYLNHVSQVLDEANIKREIMIQDVQRAIDTENPEISEFEDELANRKGHRLTWNAYHRLADIYDYLDHIAATYPRICSVQTIGSSVQSRPIKLLKLSNGNANNKAVWIDGGVHAREWISPAVVTYIINNFIENYENESEDVKNLDWYFVPVVNPDGYEYSHTVDRLWRKNRSGGGRCAGTDLNRNFGYKWGGKGSSKNSCTEIYGGQSAFSEPETTAIRNFITSSNADFKAYLSFHSYGQYILYPWGYDRFVPPDYKDLQAVALKAANAMKQIGGMMYTVGPAANTLYPASGGSDDWAKGVAKIKYAYTIELRDTGRHGFILPANYIGVTAKEAIAGVRVFAAAARTA